MEELYKACESLCQHKFADSTYANVGKELRLETNSIFNRLCASETRKNGFLFALTEEWAKFTESMLSIRSVFLYLDRSYVLSAGLKSVWEQAFKYFAENVMNSKQGSHRERTITDLLALIESVRAACDLTEFSASKDLIENTSHVLDALGMYLTHFEPKLLARTQTFYHNRSCLKRGIGLSVDASLQNEADDLCTPTDYLHWVQSTLQMEHRLISLLKTESMQPLISVIRRELVAAHIPFLLSGVDHWMTKSCYEDLSFLFLLFDSIGKVTPDLRNCITSWVYTIGTEIIQEKSCLKISDFVDSNARSTVEGNIFGSKASMVDFLLMLKIHLERIAELCFKNNEALVSGVKDAFSRFLNIVQHRPAELMAKFVDEILKSRRTVNESEIEGILDHVLQLFRHIQGKDTFIAFYKVLLAKRLLSGKTTSVDAEKSMLSKLRIGMWANLLYFRLFLDLF
jgi:cullin-4